MGTPRSASKAANILSERTRLVNPFKSSEELCALCKTHGLRPETVERIISGLAVTPLSQGFNKKKKSKKMKFTLSPNQLVLVTALASGISTVIRDKFKGELVPLIPSNKLNDLVGGASTILSKFEGFDLTFKSKGTTLGKPKIKDTKFDRIMKDLADYYKQAKKGPDLSFTITLNVPF